MCLTKRLESIIFVICAWGKRNNMRRFEKTSEEIKEKVNKIFSSKNEALQDIKEELPSDMDAQLNQQEDNHNE